MFSQGQGQGQGGFGQAIGAGLGNIFGGMMYHPHNPAHAAQPYLNQIPGVLHPYFDPYVHAGENAMGTLQDQYNMLLKNPAAMMGQIGAGYHSSPGYQFQVDQATGAANRAAAAGGMLGSPMEQQNLATTVNGLANQDYYNYMNQALGQYGMGIQGMQGINQLGYGASSDLANSLAQQLMNQGQLAYTGAANQNNMQGQRAGMFGAGLGTLAGGLISGPFG